MIVATRSDDVIFLESHLSLSCSFAIDDMMTSVDRELKRLHNINCGLVYIARTVPSIGLALIFNVRLIKVLR